MAEIDQIAAFRRIIDKEVGDFVTASYSFGGLLATMADKVKAAFEAELVFITSGVAMNRPDETTIGNMAKPLGQIIAEIQDFRDSNRHEEVFFNHLTTIMESICGLTWIVRPIPVSYIRETRDAGIYFSNRVLSAHRSNQQHLTWIKLWGDVLNALEQYVKEYHKTGFDWGAAVRANLVTPRMSGSGGSPPSAAGAAVPPPPPPPPTGDEKVNLAAGDVARNALFSQINKEGASITQILKPVKKEPLTSPVRRVTPSSSYAMPSSPVQHTPKLELKGRKWCVEYQKDNYALVVESTDMSESLAMYKCENVGLELRNKMNGISIDNTKKSMIALSDVISSVELIRCSDVKIQCNGRVPLISVDKCESVQIFLTSTSIGVELISSNSTALNVCILEDDGTYVELPVPEQIRSIILNGKMHSKALEKN